MHLKVGDISLLRTLLAILGLAGLAQYSFSAPPLRAAQQERPSLPYHFTSDVFSSNIPVWRKVLAPYAGRPNVHYLEVGVLEGRSAIWMLENILTHPSSTLTGVDLFPGDLQERYLANLQLSGYAGKAITIKGLSQLELRRLQPDSYDIIYVDGGHTADMVLADAALCWQVLKTGGLLIFDDYRWERETYPDELRPGVARRFHHGLSKLPGYRTPRLSGHCSQKGRSRAVGSLSHHPGRIRLRVAETPTAQTLGRAAGRVVRHGEGAAGNTGTFAPLRRDGLRGRRP